MVVKLRIIEINGYNYEPLDQSGQRYKLNLEFIDLFEDPKEDDFIVMEDCLLNIHIIKKDDHQQRHLKVQFAILIL